MTPAVWQLWIDNVLVPTSKIVLNEAEWIPAGTEASFDLTPMVPISPDAITASFTALWRSSPLFRRWLKPWHHFTGRRHRGTPKWARRYHHKGGISESHPQAEVAA